MTDNDSQYRVAEAEQAAERIVLHARAVLNWYNDLTAPQAAIILREVNRGVEKALQAKEPVHEDGPW